MQINPQLVYDYLLTIPYGKVVTYKTIAIHLGNANYARVVGNILHKNPDTNKYPCFKVVNSKGELALHFKDGIKTQKARLESEDIIVQNNKVNLVKYEYK